MDRVHRETGRTEREARHSANIRIVLVRPQGMMNIGSVARAMKNVGLTKLALVNPVAPHLHPDARLMAVGAHDILEDAMVSSCLTDALADCAWVVGTTRRRGKGRAEIFDLRQTAAELADIAQQNKVAVVFGPEDRGLTNRDLDLCQRLMTIPAHEEHGSLNLAQAVMVVCYEIYLAIHHQKASSRTRQLATSEELEGMYRHMEETLLRIGFLDQDNPKRVMAMLRRIFSRTGLNSREVKILRGICRQAHWYARQKKPQ